MKFKFPFETLRKVRKREEEVAQKEYLEARTQLEELLYEIDEMYKSIDKSRLSISRLQFGKEALRIEEIQALEAFILGQHVRIRSERVKARELMRNVEEKQDIFFQKARDFKVIDRLREKRMSEFRRNKRKKEEKQMDEIVVLRSKRGAS